MDAYSLTAAAAAVANILAANLPGDDVILLTNFFAMLNTNLDTIIAVTEIEKELEEPGKIIGTDER